jgi:hypothetical protein
MENDVEFVWQTTQKASNFRITVVARLADGDGEPHPGKYPYSYSAGMRWIGHEEVVHFSVPRKVLNEWVNMWKNDGHTHRVGYHFLMTAMSHGANIGMTFNETAVEELKQCVAAWVTYHNQYLDKTPLSLIVEDIPEDLL